MPGSESSISSAKAELKDNLSQVNSRSLDYSFLVKNKQLSNFYYLDAQSVFI